MTSAFESSEYLRFHWRRINHLAFEGRLPPLADIGWQVLDDEDGSLDVYGGFSSRANAIGITSYLKRAEEVEAAIQARRSSSKSEDLDLASVPAEDHDLIWAVAGLIAHEMAHQAVFVFEDGGEPNSHGELFVKYAKVMVEQMGFPEVTIRNAAAWPYVLPVIHRERQRASKPIR